MDDDIRKGSDYALQFLLSELRLPPIMNVKVCLKADNQHTQLDIK